MPKVWGGDTHVWWLDSSGTVILTAYRTKLETTWTAETIETTSGTVTSKEYLAGLMDFKASITLFYFGTATPFGTAELLRLAPRAYGTLVWGEHGTTTGMTKHGWAGFITSHKESLPFGDDAITLDFEIQGTGGPVYAYGSTF